MTDADHMEYAPQSNWDVYPESAAFEDYYDSHVAPNFDETGDSRTDPINRAVCVTLFKVMHENLGEYEHGSADVDLVFQSTGMPMPPPPESDEDDRPVKLMMLKAYRAVCEDVLLSLQAHLRD